MNRADLYLVLGWAFGAAKQRGDTTIADKAAALLEQATDAHDGFTLDFQTEAERDAAMVLIGAAMDVPNVANDGELPTYGKNEIARILNAAQAFRRAKK